VVGAFKPYHHCWHFVAYAVVLFASASCWGSTPRKARWGGLKEARGGRCAATIAYFVVFRTTSLFLA